MDGFVLNTSLTRSGTAPNNIASADHCYKLKGDMIASIIFVTMLSLLAIVGNGMVMLAFKFDRKLRSPTNIFILCLAIIDFLVGIISMPIYISNYVEQVIYGSFNGSITYFPAIDLYLCSVTIFQLTAISVERCFSILAPIKHRSLSARYYYLMIFLVWSIPAINVVVLKHGGSNKLFSLYIFVADFLIPLTIITTSFTVLFRAKIKQAQRLINLSTDLSWSKQMKTAVTLIIISALFIITWSPLFVYHVLSPFYSDKPWFASLEHCRVVSFIKWLSYCNSAINPIIYAYRNEKFRHSFKVILNSCMKCKRFDEVNREIIRRRQFPEAVS